MKESTAPTKVFSFSLLLFLLLLFFTYFIFFQARSNTDAPIGSVRNKWRHGENKIKESDEDEEEGEEEEREEGEEEVEKEGEKEKEEKEKEKEEKKVEVAKVALDDEDSILEHTTGAVAAVGGLAFEIPFDDKVHFLFLNLLISDFYLFHLLFSHFSLFFSLFFVYRNL